ncbi:MAG: N-acetylglutamate synthase [Streptomyces sp.]|nr:N-acetylglutamate synthase [Streptomyces sp.]
MSMDFAAGGRPDLRLTASDVGKRVSVRRIAEVVEGRPVFRDAVGLLTSWNDGVLIVTRRTGEAVHIAESSVVAGKVVPDTPLRRGVRAPRATAQELQEIASRDWPAQETERLGDWILRAAGGFTRRANSVLPFGDPGIPVAAAAGRIVEWYAARGLHPCVQVTDEGLDGELAALGWTKEAEALLRTAPLPPLADLPGAERVRLSREVDAEWMARYHRTGALGEEAVKVLTGGPSVWFATVPGAEGPAAIGRCVVDGAWAMFGAVEVDPASRRQGLATAVMAALALRAVAEGASGAYLQVEADNEGARSMYDRLGFTTHHAYHYRRAPKG